MKKKQFEKKLLSEKKFQISGKSFERLKKNVILPQKNFFWKNFFKLGKNLSRDEKILNFRQKFFFEKKIRIRHKSFEKRKEIDF